MTVEEIRQQALELAEKEFKKFEPVALYIQKKYWKHLKSASFQIIIFNGTSGYGYNDVGREKLDEVFAHVFKGERAIVRPHFVSGTHALATTLQAILGNGAKGKVFVYAVGATI